MNPGFDLNISAMVFSAFVLFWIILGKLIHLKYSELDRGYHSWYSRGVVCLWCTFIGKANDLGNILWDQNSFIIKVCKFFIKCHMQSFHNNQRKHIKTMTPSKNHKTIKSTPTCYGIPAIFSIAVIVLVLKNILFIGPKLPKSVFELKDIFFQFEPLLNFNKKIQFAGVGCENEKINNGRSYVDKNIDISECFFSRSVSYSGYGGVIYVNGGSFSMFINNSMFHYCVCTQSGGAIYFKSANSILKMICANGCSSSTNNLSDYVGNFACFIASQTNQADFLSITNCSHITFGCNTVRFQLGYQRVDNTNSSMNNAADVSGILIESPSSFASIFRTFSNNKVSSSNCISFYYDSGTMEYANIIHNNSPSWAVVYIHGAGARKMIYCIFQNNQECLFCIYAGSLELSHSFIDHSSTFSRSTAVSTEKNNSFTKILTYQIQFFNSFYCNADIIQSTPLNTKELTHLDSQQPTIEITKYLTPYRSFDEQHFQQTLFPEHTPYDTHHPIHTPYDTHHLERTNQRSFPLDFVERTPSTSSEHSNNNLDIDKSNQVLIYSAVGLLIFNIIIIYCYNGYRKNQNPDESSTSSIEMMNKEEKKTKREQFFENENITDQKRNHHNGSSSGPYVF